MTDIGFGLINRRTIIVTLFCMVISVSLFKNQLPINTSSAASIFIDLVLFTGYIMLLRSVYLAPFGLIYSIKEIYWHYGKFNSNHHQPETKNGLRVLIKSIFAKIIVFFRSITIFIRVLPSFLHYFGRWLDLPDFLLYDFSISDDYKVKGYEISYNTDIPIKRVIRFFDRAGLICIVFLSTYPTFMPLVKITGEIGLIFSVIIFLFRGDFSFIVKDSVGARDNQIE